MAVAMYLRKSRADREAEARGEGETLARHEKILKDLASKTGLKIGAVYKELVSGETISARPQMQHLLLEVMQGKWDGVLVMEVERLARGDTRDQGTVSEAFKLSGTKIITPIKIYDPNNPYDEEYFEFSLFMSRREYKAITRRIQTGRLAAFNDGWYIAGTAPYGYKKVKKKGDRGYTLEIVEEEAQVVRMIYQMYTEGILQPDGSFKAAGSFQIRDRLNDLGIPSRTNGKWTAPSILDILHNPTYAGYQRWQWRKEQKSFSGNEIVKSRRKDENCLKVRGRFTPIISMDTYNSAQETRKGKKTAHYGSYNALCNPLSGLVYCQKCHTLMSRQLSNTKDRYAILRCPNSQCSNISSPLYLIEQKVIEGLEEWVQKYELEWPEDMLGNTQETITLLENSIKTLQSKREQIEVQLSNTYDLLEQGIYSLSTFKERRTILEEKKNTLDTELENLQIEQKTLIAQEQARKDFIPSIHRIIDAYWNIEDVEVKNSMLHEVLDHIDYLKTDRTKKGTRDSAYFTLHFYPKIPENR